MLNKKLLGSVSSPPQDDNFENVTLLLNGDGTNGAQNNTFVDSSTNNFTITRNGNTTQGSFSPYGNLWSNFFNGSNSYLSVPDNAALELGTASFTMEAFVYPTSFANTGVIFSKMADSGTPSGFLIQSNSSTGITKLYVSSNGSSWDIVSDVGSIALTLNSWNHVAVARSGSSFRIWVNGASSGTATDSGSVQNNSAPVFIGAAGQSSTTNYIAGYVSQARIVNGTDVYGVSNSTITVPTTPLTAITNTALLTCADNRFIDDSTNNFTITPVGSPSVQRFSPFNPTAPYDTSVIGGSGYFDGSGDTLVTPSNAAVSAWTGDFTIECWIYVVSFPLYSPLWTNSISSSDGMTAATLYDTGSLSVGKVGVNEYVTATGSIKLGQWTHIAVVGNSGTATTYINGISAASGSQSTYISTSTKTLTLGGSYQSPPNYANIYMSNFRAVNGTAVYTANFTPPTSPLTAITNTSLLLSYINAGIPDLAMQNNLETVGNAQVSTSVKKYGTGSLAFDGTGDYLVSPTNLPFSFGTGNFTIELWIYTTSTAADQGVIDCRSVPGLSNWLLNIQSGTRIDFIYGSTRLQASSAISTNAWYHLAIVRNNGVITIYVDGVSKASATYTSAIDSGLATPNIGRATDPAAFTGYIDDLRISKIARYTAAFTPPTKALETY